MDFLKLVRKRSFLSELVYTILNITLAIGVLLIIRFTDSVSFAVALVALSKWRIFAVRPRYWLANIRSNIVDFIVSISLVLHLHIVNSSGLGEGQKLLVMLILTGLYVAWLLFIKPRSKRSYVALQAGVALLFGTAALYEISYAWPASAVVAVMGLIGYAAARHVLSTYDDETHGLFLGLVWGLVIAEIGWVAYHWTVAYPVLIAPSLMVPQVALIVTLVSFLGYKVYDSFAHHAKVRMNDVMLPLLFSLSIILMLVTIFNRVGSGL